MTKRVLILCTGNSCRSQMAEVIWNQLGKGNWKAESAGSKPAGYVHPLALKALEEIDLPTNDLTSKPMDPFIGQDIDMIVTVCDNAQESCPALPGVKVAKHWPFDDPADAEGNETEQMKVFRRVRDEIRETIAGFLATEPA